MEDSQDDPQAPLLPAPDNVDGVQQRGPPHTSPAPPGISPAALVPSPAPAATSPSPARTSPAPPGISPAPDGTSPAPPTTTSAGTSPATLVTSPAGTSSDPPGTAPACTSPAPLVISPADTSPAPPGTAPAGTSPAPPGTSTASPDTSPASLGTSAAPPGTSPASLGTSAAPPGTSPASLGTSAAPPGTSRELCRIIRQRTKGRSWLRRVRKVRHGHLVLIVAGSLIVGVFLGCVITSRVTASGFPTFLPESSACPNKWVRSDAKCFFVSRETKNWNASLEFCRSEGGTLLTVDNETQEEIRTLHDLAGDYWIGLMKDKDSGEWRQLDGSVWTKPIEFDDPKRKCSFVDSRKYVALDCSTPRRWICVKSLKRDQ